MQVGTDQPSRFATERTGSMLRHASSDALLLGAALLQALVLAASFLWLAPSGPAGAVLTLTLFAVSICWCSNTVAHIHLHKPLFAARGYNRALSLALGVLIGVPQSVWRARHLWHHAGEPSDRRPKLLRVQSVLEALPIVALWSALLALAPSVFWFVYLPGLALGMALCQLQGQMEHAHPEQGPQGVSHYGRLHNLLWFNDGYHAEHHRWPGEHWSRLPERRLQPSGAVSQWPPLLRALERAPGSGEPWHAVILGWLERLALRSKRLQRFMLDTHEAAFRRLLPAAMPVERIAIIGGGLFPRTLLVLARLFPGSSIVVIDSSARNVAIASRYLAAEARGLQRVSFVTEAFSAERHSGFDLLVAPLAFVGDRSELSRAEPRLGLITHDWIWRAPGRRSAVISWFLCKRLNLFWEGA